MSTIGDLMGLGMPAALAARLGNTPATLTAAASTSQTGAAVLTNHVTLISAATGLNSVIFATAAALGTPWYITNSTASAASALVYCPVSGTMNQTSNGSTTLATGKTAIFIQNAQSSWVSVLTA
jgi:hypothetical protein